MKNWSHLPKRVLQLRHRSVWEVNENPNFVVRSLAYIRDRRSREDELLAGLIAHPPNTQKEKAMQREHHKASTRSLQRSANSKNPYWPGESVDRKYTRIIFLNSQSPPRIPAALTIWRPIRSTFRRSARIQLRRVSA